MNKMKHVFSFLAVAALLSACTQDELTDNGQDTPLPEGKYPLTLTTASLAGNTPASRSTVDGSWNGEKVYVQVVDKYESEEPQWYNSKTMTCTVASGGGMTKDSGNSVYWQTPGENKAIRAWCVPGVTQYDIDLPSSHTVKTDQSGVGYAQSDFLYAKQKSSFAEGKDGVGLQFYHQVAKVKVNIVRGEDTPADFVVTGLTIGGVTINGNFYAPQFDSAYNHGLWSSISDNNTITPRKATDVSINNLLAAYEAIVIPQVVTNGTKLFSIKARGYSNFVYTTTENNVWEPGKEYTYNITVKAEGLSVTTNQSIDWDETGSTGSGSITLP